MELPWSGKENQLNFITYKIGNRVYKRHPITEFYSMGKNQKLFKNCGTL